MYVVGIVASSPDPIPAFQCCESWDRARPGDEAMGIVDIIVMQVAEVWWVLLVTVVMQVR